MQRLRRDRLSTYRFIWRVAVFITCLSTILVMSTNQRAQSTPSLKDVFKSDFMIGAALNRRQFSEEDTRALPIIKSQFNTISPENQLKWQSIHPQPDKYDFDGADRYVAFGEKYGMFVIGHTLVWHNQTPAWVFDDGKGNLVDRDTLLKRMRDHIRTVVGRYKGRIKGWDVVNEAVNADGTLRQSKWLKIIGEDYIAKAFQFAHEADPQAELYYNDYSLENEPKRNGAVQLIKKLKADGIPIIRRGRTLSRRARCGTRNCSDKVTNSEFRIAGRTHPLSRAGSDPSGNAEELFDKEDYAVRQCGDDGGHRDGEYPCPDYAARDAPFHC